jgi:hypothetical protein
MSLPYTVDELVKMYVPSNFKMIFLDSIPEGGIEGLNADGVTDLLNMTITCRPPTDVETLYVFLHECGHAKYHSSNPHKWASIQYRYLAEYQAERYAQEQCKLLGIDVPAYLVECGKKQIYNDSFLPAIFGHVQEDVRKYVESYDPYVMLKHFASKEGITEEEFKKKHNLEELPPER